MIVFSTRWDQKIKYGDYLKMRRGWKLWAKANIEEGKYHFGDYTVTFKDEEDAMAFRLIVGNDILTDPARLP